MNFAAAAADVQCFASAQALQEICHAVTVHCVKKKKKGKKKRECRDAPCILSPAVTVLLDLSRAMKGGSKVRLRHRSILNTC